MTAIRRDALPQRPDEVPITPISDPVLSVWCDVGPEKCPERRGQRSPPGKRLSLVFEIRMAVQTSGR